MEVRGSGWWAGQPVRLHWGSSDGPLLVEAAPAPRAGASPGSFTGSFVVPDVPPGTYGVAAVGGEPAYSGGAAGRGVTVSPIVVRAPFVVVAAQPSETAPVLLEQTLTIIGGAPVPTLGQRTDYEHFVRITNTTGRALDLSRLALENLLAAALQGQGVTVSFTTEYTEGTRVSGTTVTGGQTTARGLSVTWDGQLGAGQSVELRTGIEHTPSTPETVGRPIRGQTISVLDQRGVSLAVPHPTPPQLAGVAQ